ncbi:MAG TPA: DUF6636 domain-containing protein [Gaiellaceae bacterium]
MRYSLVVAVALVVLAGSASASSSSGLRGFQTPSRNIVCGAYVGSQPAWLRCDISSGLKPKPSRPKGCEFDFGGTLTLGATGRARIGCVSDVVLPDPNKAPVLAYGKSWSYGPFKCRSARVGLTCRNLKGHGFFLSRGRWTRL